MKLSVLLNDENLTDKKKNKIIFVGISDNYQKAKYALVFGHPEYLHFRVQKAIDLYKKGIIEKIILSGGIGKMDTISKESEAIKMKRIALKQGVPEEALILEDKSTTTIENVQNVEKYLKGIPKSDISKIILVSSVWHMRRCRAIAQKYLSEVKEFYFAPVHDNVAESEVWKSTELGRELVENEIYYLTKHIRQEKIADLDVDFERETLDR